MNKSSFPWVFFILICGILISQWMDRLPPMAIDISVDRPATIDAPIEQEDVLGESNLWISVAETIDMMTSLDEEEVNNVTNAYMEVFDSISNRNLMPYVLGIMVIESGCNYQSAHKISSARGIGQVIYRYHPYLADEDISKKDLTTDLRKSIMATYLVLERYWVDNDFSYKQAILAYRGRDYEAYYNRVTEVACMFGCKILR